MKIALGTLIGLGVGYAGHACMLYVSALKATANGGTATIPSLTLKEFLAPRATSAPANERQFAPAGTR